MQLFIYNGTYVNLQWAVLDKKNSKVQILWENT